MLTCRWHELAQVRSCAALALASVVKADPAAAASEVRMLTYADVCCLELRLSSKLTRPLPVVSQL